MTELEKILLFALEESRSSLESSQKEFAVAQTQLQDMFRVTSEEREQLALEVRQLTRLLSELAEQVEASSEQVEALSKQVEALSSQAKQLAVLKS